MFPPMSLEMGYSIVITRMHMAHTHSHETGGEGVEGGGDARSLETAA